MGFWLHWTNGVPAALGTPGGWPMAVRLAFAGVGLVAALSGVRILLSEPKPVLRVSNDGVEGRRIWGGQLSLAAGDLEKVLGGGDNLRLRLRSGRVESVSMILLSKQDREAAVVAVEELVRETAET